MRFKRRLLSVVLVVVLASSTLLSPVAVCAQTSSDLYGTGSADEINIIKLIDMALNKGGMSMSPSTIKAFLDFWWSSVRADLDKCISNADSAITTTQAFADYVISALENSDHYDNLGPIMVKYVQYVCALSGKSLSDIKHLILQPGTFRQFLLSYVTDEDGNIAGTVDNKLKKYQLKTGLVNMVREAADAYIEEYEGYYLVKSFMVGDILPSYFSNKQLYDSVLSSVKHNLSLGTYGYTFSSGSFYISDLNGINFVYKESLGSVDSDVGIGLQFFNDDWTQQLKCKSCSSYGDVIYVDSENMNWNFTFYKPNGVYRKSVNFNLSMSSDPCCNFVIFTSDGQPFKIWKSLDGFKNYSVGKSDIYYTNIYSSYDSGVDNSIEFTGAYYSNNSSSYSHDIIQNTIDNSQTIDESTVNNIVNNYITNNNYGDSSGSGSGSDDWWDIGSGIDAFIKGVAALLDFLLKLIGDLVGLLSSFLSDLLTIMGNFAALGQGFSNFLTAAFGFIPEECISIIIISIGVICALGVFKIFKK